MVGPKKVVSLSILLMILSTVAVAGILTPSPLIWSHYFEGKNCLRLTRSDQQQQVVQTVRHIQQLMVRFLCANVNLVF